MPPGFWCADTLMQSGDAHYHYFNFQRGQRDRHLHTQDFFFLQPLCTPPFLFFTSMFNIKDEDSKRWGSNVYSLRTYISLHVLHTLPLYTGVHILRAKWSRLRKEPLQYFKHTKTFSHIDTQKGTYRKRGIYKQDTETKREINTHIERHALRGTCTHSEKARQKYLQKEGQRDYKDISTHENRICTRGESEEAIWAW